MLKTTLIVAALAVGALLAYAASRPDSFSVRRTVSIGAPANKIHPLINDLQRFNAWNPFNKKDPAIKGSYRGPASGKGAAYDFDGNQEVGTGSLEILDSAAPNRVTMKLDMREPMEAHNIVEFSLVPRGERSTEVSWVMHGPSPFVAKLMGLVFDIDRMVGGEFDKGLADLKTLAERP